MDLDLGYDQTSAGAAFKELLRRWDDEELQSAAQQLDELTAHPGYKALNRLIRERIQKSLRSLTGGNPKADAVEYVAVLKWLHGMEQVLLVPEVVHDAHRARIEKNANAQAEAERAEENAA